MTLNQVTIFLKTHWRLIIFVPIIVSVLIFLIFIRFLRGQTPQEEPRGLSWNGIYAGTTKEELESKLGQPLKIEGQDGDTLYSYPSTNQYRPHQVELSQNTISIIKEQIIGNEKGTLQNYIDSYGQPGSKVYGQHGTFAPGNLWGQQGIIVFANDLEGTIVEIWYFQPTTLEEFLIQNPQIEKDEPENF